MSALVIASPRMIVPTSPWMPTRHAIEILWDDLEGFERQIVDRIFDKGKSLRDRFAVMAGSDCVRLSTVLGELAFGKTAYAGETTIFGALYTAAIDDTLLGNTANEAAYTSYARLSLTNNTTIFAAGSGTTTRTQTFPSDATKSFATSTGGSSTVTYLGFLNGNAGTSSDKGLVWASVTSTAIASGDTPQLAQNAVSQVRD
jgi:hypothetical protein